MRILFLLLFLVTLNFALPIDAPIAPWEYQALLGRGFDVAWAEFTVKINGYGVDEVSAMKQHGFQTARIRTNLPADSALFAILDVRVQDCLDSGIVPIIAYQGGLMEVDPSPANIQAAVDWWQTVANHYADYSHRLGYDIVVEWTDSMSKSPTQINQFYETVTPVIRQNNPTRMIIYSPMRISNPEYLDSMIIPASAGSYVMAEWHFYAAGPSADSTSPKYWTTGTEAQKKLVTDKVTYATNWQTAHNIPTWVGAWMAGNYNKGNTTPMETQLGFAQYIVSVLDSVHIPWCINTIDKFYDYNANSWIDSMTALRDVIAPASVVTPLSKPSISSSVEKESFTLVGNVLKFSSPMQRTIELYTLQGRRIVSFRSSAAEFSIPVGVISSGLYTVRSSNAAGTVMSRFVRLH